jgi:hypothetical protein
MKRLLFALFCAVGISGQTTAELRINFAETTGPMKINQMALGQGGLCDQVMWDGRIPEIRALHPVVVRLFTGSISVCRS